MAPQYRQQQIGANKHQRKSVARAFSSAGLLAPRELQIREAYTPYPENYSLSLSDRAIVEQQNTH